MTEYTRITSRKNENVLRAASLSRPKGRDEENAFFTEGMKLFAEAVSAGFSPREVFLLDSFLSTPDAERFISMGIDARVFSVTREVYEKISDESAPEGIFAVFEKHRIAPTRDSVILLLENVRDPGNLGTVLRSAAAFGAREVVGVGCCDVFAPKTVRATMGAIFRMPYTEFDALSSALEYVRRDGRAVFAAALSPSAVDIAEADTARACIMIGNEGHGLSPEALAECDAEVIIPIEAVESLNASVAASVVLYDSFRKREGKR